MRFPRPGLFGVLYDSCHFGVGKPSGYIEAIRILGSRIRYIHLSDSDQRTSELHYPLGKGRLDIDGVLGALSEVDFSGQISLDTFGYPHARGGLEDRHPRPEEGARQAGAGLTSSEWGGPGVRVARSACPGRFRVRADVGLRPRSVRKRPSSASSTRSGRRCYQQASTGPSRSPMRKAWTGGGQEEGPPPAWGYGFKTSPLEAALINGMLVEGLDYSDVHVGAGLHPTSVILPAVVAYAEREGDERRGRSSGPHYRL